MTDTTAVTMPAMTYRPCPTCEAAIVIPFPPTWTLDLIKEGPRLGPVEAFATPHSPACPEPVPSPEPGKVVRVSGEYVSDLNIQMCGVELP